ncbi:PREDICTED: cytochrome P450 2U1-like [Priapulus caudatus]|uniref:Cytochrome P450 2U1-like n=1 Tax=Priapulus caudatus TaxID=37621 RepID=A0ABM1EI24_PRICU|nr:PREDICTED: cytochrome P450 2U1-like [Priapulus caudatus]
MVGVSTIICSLVFGKHYTHDDAFLKQYLEILDEMAANMSNGAAAAFLPFLRILPGNVLTKFKRNSDWIRANWLDIELVEHKETVDVSNPRDYIDAYLAKMQTTKEGSTSRHPTTHMSDEQLVACLGDLFAAGTETTTNTLKWGLLYMLRYPDIQRKVQAELDEVVGRGRLPSIKDKPNLPYTHAAVLEMLRCSSVVPLGVLRATTKETTIGGYRIPNRTVLIPNLWAVTHDPRYWEKPDEFYPEHFLDADGKVTNREALIPFSSGTRLCIGELLARMELFLFFSSVLQRFTLAPPEGSPRPEAKGKLGITLSPQPYKLTATLR